MRFKGKGDEDLTFALALGLSLILDLAPYTTKRFLRKGTASRTIPWHAKLALHDSQEHRYHDCDIPLLHRKGRSFESPAHFAWLRDCPPPSGLKKTVKDVKGHSSSISKPCASDPRQACYGPLIFDVDLASRCLSERAINRDAVNRAGKAKQTPLQPNAVQQTVSVVQVEVFAFWTEMEMELESRKRRRSHAVT